VRSRQWLLAAACILPLLAVACGEDKSGGVLAGYHVEPSPAVGSLALPDAGTGEDFGFVAPSGHFLVVYFGYTSCPDVCPTTLNEVRKALKDIGGDAARVDVAMVTIDPARDTDELLRNYLGSFVDDGHALRTDDPDLLREVADGFGASYSVTENASGDIEVSHSGNLYVVDDTGALVLQWPYGLLADAISNDLSILLSTP
jgi:protein SCO1/2